MRHVQTCLSLLLMAHSTVGFSLPAVSASFAAPGPTAKWRAQAGRSMNPLPVPVPALRNGLGVLRGGSGLSAIARQPAHDGADPAHVEDPRSEKIWKAMYAAAAVAATGGLAFSIEQGGTYFILSYLKQATASPTFTELLGWLMEWAQDASLGGLALSATACTALQLLPVFNGILLAMAMGAMWGTWKGLACASFGATTAALLAALTSRYVLRDALGASGVAKPPAILDAVASSLSASQRRSLALMALLRLSPVIPFVWSNYLLGLTPVNLVPYTVGTWLGTLPALTVFVLSLPPPRLLVPVERCVAALCSVEQAGPAEGRRGAGLLAAGAAATAAVLAIIGRISQQELAKQAGQQPEERSS